MITTTLRRAARLVAATMVASILAAALAAAEPVPVDGGELATIRGTEQFLVQSDLAGEDFLVQVATPNVGGPFPAPDHRFPVVYVTDGGGLFPLAGAARGNPDGMVEPAYVVGITYREDLDSEGGNNWRMRDLLHNPDPPPFPGTPPGTPPPGNMPPVMGEGAAFEAFLLKELRPLIESRYPVDPDRSVLVGHSLGGTFTAMVLSHDPRAFSGYIIGSPGMWLEPDLAERIASVASEAGGGKVYIGVGELEPPFVAMADELEAALTGPDSAFDVRRETFADEGHGTVPFILITRGLRHVLPGSTPRGGFAVP